MCFTCSCKHWSSHFYQILMKLFSTVHQTLIQTLVFIELLLGAFSLLIQSFRPKLQIPFKRVSLVLIEFLMGAFFFWYKFFHQSYKSHSRESGLYWASGGCFLLLIQKISTKVTNLIQESLVFIEHLVSAFFCWYKSFHQSYIFSFKRVWWSLLSFWWVLSFADTEFFFQPRYKAHSSSVSVSFFSLSLSGAFCVSFIELSGGLFYFPFLWSLMGIVSLRLFCFDFSSKCLSCFLMCWYFLCYFEVRASFIAIHVVVRSEIPLLFYPPPTLFFLLKLLWTIILNYIHFGFQILQRCSSHGEEFLEKFFIGRDFTNKFWAINEVFIEYPHFQEYSTDWVSLQHFHFNSCCCWFEMFPIFNYCG